MSPAAAALDPMACSFQIILATSLLGVLGLRAEGTGPFFATAAEPDFDRRMYPHSPTSGVSPTASTYTALPTDGGVDDRFAQYIVKFNTEAIVPKGLGPENYDPRDVMLTAIIFKGDLYDPTEDPRASHGPNAIPDTDPGRVMEVHGTGFRSPFTAATYQKNSPFGSAAPSQRNAYAMGFSPEGVARDVSHNVTLGYDSIPWAVGKAYAVVDVDADPKEYVPILPGGSVPKYSKIEFKLNLALPGVAAYVKQGLHDGYLWLTLSSLHSVEEMSSTGYPSYFTKDNSEHEIFRDVAPSLKIEYSLPLNIKSFTRDVAANKAAIQWNGSPGFTYLLERSADLSAASWTPVQTFTTATPATLSWNDTSAAGRMFFRVKRTRQP